MVVSEHEHEVEVEVLVHLLGLLFTITLGDLRMGLYRMDIRMGIRMVYLLRMILRMQLQEVEEVVGLVLDSVGGALASLRRLTAGEVDEVLEVVEEGLRRRSRRKRCHHDSSKLLVSGKEAAISLWVFAW